MTEDYEHCDDLFLPISYRRMRVYHPIPARLFSHIRARQGSPLRSEVETFDLTLFDEENQVLAEIEGFATRRIADPSQVQEKNAWAGDGGSGGRRTTD